MTPKPKEALDAFIFPSIKMFLTKRVSVTDFSSLSTLVSGLVSVSPSRYSLPPR